MLQWCRGSVVTCCSGDPIIRPFLKTQNYHYITDCTLASFLWTQPVLLISKNTCIAQKQYMNSKSSNFLNNNAIYDIDSIGCDLEALLPRFSLSSNFYIVCLDQGNSLQKKSPHMNCFLGFLLHLI